VTSADDPIDEEEDSVPPAISGSIDLTQTRDRRGAKPTKLGSSPTPPLTRTNDESGSAIGDADRSPALPESLPSMHSVMPPRRSSRRQQRWGTPRSVQELAGQANQVATLMLNGEIDMELARSYGSLVRGIAQMMSIEVTRARFVKTEPILTFTTPEDE
jgi:hypothetical protein